MCREPLLAALPSLGLPYGITVHDLNLACPTTTMIGADGFWCGAHGDVGACVALRRAQAIPSRGASGIAPSSPARHS